MNADHGIDVIALPVSVLVLSLLAMGTLQERKSGNQTKHRKTSAQLLVTITASIQERPCLICSYRPEANFGVTILVVMQ